MVAELSFLRWSPDGFSFVVAKRCLDEIERYVGGIMDGIKKKFSQNRLKVREKN